MTDNWDIEEGYLNQGGIIGYVTLGTVVVAGDPVKWGTAAQNQVVMSKWTAQGDSVGVAQRGGNTGDKIPVVFWGVVKMTNWIAVGVGDAVMNARTVGTTISWGNVVPIQTLTAGQLVLLRGLNNTGTICRLGTAIQAGTTPGDTLLVLVGKLP